MRKKMEFAKKSYIIVVIISIYILSLSVGYAFFNEALTINGVASTVDYYEGTKLPVQAIIRNTSDNYYFTADFNKGYLLAYEGETWEEETYTLELDKMVLSSIQGNEVTYTISFTNPTVLNYTDGFIITGVGNNSEDITSTSGMLSKAEVAPGESVDVSLKVTANNFNNTDSIARATITYTFQNKPRILNFVIKFKAEGNYQNLLTDELLLNHQASGNAEKTADGYLFNYPTYYKKTTNAALASLLENLKPGVTYMLIRDYEGDMGASNGSVRFYTSDNQLIVAAPTGVGVKSVTFTLTQEQIDSIDRLFIYGHNTGSGLFKFIQLRELN